MPGRPSQPDSLATELKVLQAMCTGTPEGTVWDKGMLLLGTYPFRDVVHQLIFDVLQEINTDRPDIIRKQLPTRLTKKGFPAVDWGKFLAPHTLTSPEVVALMHTLRQWAEGKERADATVR